MKTYYKNKRLANYNLHIYSKRKATENRIQLDIKGS